MTNADETPNAFFSRCKESMAQSGIYRPSQDLAAIVAHICNVPVQSDESFLWPKQRALSAQEKQDIWNLVERRQKSEPLARLLGLTTFCDVDIEVAQGVFRPLQSTEAVVDYAMLEAEKRSGPVKILDLGTGTGCVLLALLKALPEATGLGIDRDEETIALAQKNAARNNLTDRVRFITGNWADGIDETFDIIVSNPPAIPTEMIAQLLPELRDHDPHPTLDGGPDGLAFYRWIDTNFSRLTKPGGVGLFQIHLGGTEAKAFDPKHYDISLLSNYCPEPICLRITEKR